MADEHKDIGLSDALELLFQACGEALPYLERSFEKTSPPQPDYFALPKVIQNLMTAMEAGRKFRKGISHGEDTAAGSKDEATGS